jgi:DnaJ-class molecular chaperone
MSLLYHPDKSTTDISSNQKQEKMQKLQSAYKLLKEYLID